MESKGIGDFSAVILHHCNILKSSHDLLHLHEEFVPETETLPTETYNS